MDGSTIINMIGSLGFPIVAAIFLAWNQVTNMKEFREAMEKNTTALQELTIYIKNLEDRKDKE